MSGCPFDVGDVVVCVDAKPDRDDPKADLLREGRNYRIAAVGVPKDSRDGAVRVAFRSVPDPAYPGSGHAFMPRRFRKIDDGVTEEFRHQMRSLGKRDRVLA